MANSKPTKVVIRRCRAEEVETLLALWREAEANPSLTDTVEDVRRVVVESNAMVLVAEDEGRIIGSIIGAFDGWRGNIYRLAVHPDYRRQGIARTLVTQIEEHLARQGAKRITALVNKDEADAMGFWQAVGYELHPRMVRFVHNL